MPTEPKTITITIDPETNQISTSGNIALDDVAIITHAVITDAMERHQDEPEDWPNVRFENVTIPMLAAIHRAAVPIIHDMNHSGTPSQYVGTTPLEWMKHIMEMGIYNVPEPDPPFKHDHLPEPTN